MKINITFSIEIFITTIIAVQTAIISRFIKNLTQLNINYKYKLRSIIIKLLL